MTSSRARDGYVDAVEVSDGRPGFDGNRTDRLTSWLIPYPGNVFTPLDDTAFDQLMEWTVGGHLSWCVFPIDNV
jgi:hypothetical protein